MPDPNCSVCEIYGMCREDHAVRTFRLTGSLRAGMRLLPRAGDPHPADPYLRAGRPEVEAIPGMHGIYYVDVTYRRRFNCSAGSTGPGDNDGRP